MRPSARDGQLHTQETHASSVNADRFTLSRVLFFSGVGLTIAFSVAFGYITEAIYTASPSSPHSAGLRVGLISTLERLITTGLMIAGVLLYRAAPIGRRLIAMGAVVAFPALSLALTTLQGLLSTAVGMTSGPAFSAVILVTSGVMMFMHVAFLLTAWNIVAGRALSVHIIAVTGAAALTLVRVILQAAVMGAQATSMATAALTWVSSALLLVGMAVLFFVSWKRRLAVR